MAKKKENPEIKALKLEIEKIELSEKLKQQTSEKYQAVVAMVLLAMLFLVFIAVIH